MDSTMRSRTSRSPLPHGTTTRTAPKQTVTFIIRITFLFSAFPFCYVFCSSYQPFAILVYGQRISHLFPLSRMFNRLGMENSLLTPHPTVVVSELCQLFVAIPKAQALLIVFSRCLATTRARANKTKTRHSSEMNFNRQKFCSLNRKLFYLSADDAFLKTRKFLLSHFAGLTLSTTQLALVLVRGWSLNYFIRQNEIRKNVEYYARPLRENRFFVYQLWIFVWASACSLYTSAVYTPQLHNLSLST